MNIPSHHQIIECAGFGTPEVMRVAERPVPQPKAGEILVHVAAAGVNRADLMQRQGKYPPPAGASEILGMEIAGVVAKIGEGVTRWKLGDRVCAVVEGGGYAEYATVAAAQCLPVPSRLSLTEAAALPEAAMTVWANLFEAGALKPSETALVHGGSSGIGTMAIQMAKALGCKIIVTVRDEVKAAACRKLGADVVINYTQQDFVAEVAAATGGQGVNVVIDMVGGDYVARNLACLAVGGRHVSIATQQGRKVEIDLREVMARQLIVTGSTLRARPTVEKARLAREIEAKIWPLVEKSAINPLIYKVVPIKNVDEAHKMMESGEHIGKIILEVAANQ